VQHARFIANGANFLPFFSDAAQTSFVFARALGEAVLGGDHRRKYTTQMAAREGTMAAESST
jgi:hypothetical protein